MALITSVNSISGIRTGDLASDAELVYTQFAIRTSVKYGVDLASLRIHDAFATVLTGTAGTDDLALVGGAFGTDVPTIQAGNVTGGASTRRARFKTQIPGNYVNGQNFTIRVRAGMLTAVCSTSCTVDLEVYRCGQDGLVDGSDLCATAAQSMNSLTFADKDFSITATSLEAGDELDVRLSITYSDGATPTTIPCISNIWRLVHTRG